MPHCEVGRIHDPSPAMRSNSGGNSSNSNARNLAFGRVVAIIGNSSSLPRSIRFIRDQSLNSTRTGGPRNVHGRITGNLAVQFHSAKHDPPNKSPAGKLICRHFWG